MSGIAVITGGSGFIGSHLTEKLLSLGYEVRIFDDIPFECALNLNEFKGHPNLHYIQGDIRNAVAVDKLIEPEVTCIYHLSARVGIKKYIENPADVIDVNVNGTMNILTAASKLGIRVVYTSTSEVYGKNPDVPWKEDADRVLGATSIDRWSYSSSKAIGEHLAFAFYKAKKLPVSIIRYFNVYGPKQNPIFVISRNVQRILNGQSPIIYDGGGQTRCFTYIDDAIAGTILIADDPKSVGEVYNVGSDVESTIKDAVELVNHKSGMTAEIEFVKTSRLYGDKYQDIDRRIPDVSKMKDHLGWKATTSLETGILKTIEWARKNSWWLNR